MTSRKPTNSKVVQRCNKSNDSSRQCMPFTFFFLLTLQFSFTPRFCNFGNNDDNSLEIIAKLICDKIMVELFVSKSSCDEEVKKKNGGV